MNKTIPTLILAGALVLAAPLAASAGQGHHNDGKHDKGHHHPKPCPPTQSPEPEPEPTTPTVEPSPEPEPTTEPSVEPSPEVTVPVTKPHEATPPRTAISTPVTPEEAQPKVVQKHHELAETGGEFNAPLALLGAGILSLGVGAVVRGRRKAVK